MGRWLIRSLDLILLLALAGAFPVAARAQTPVPPPPTPPSTPPPATGKPVPPNTPDDKRGPRPHDMPSHWIASGFVGADFGGLADGSSFDFGGQLGYLYHGVAGAEFVGDFSPNFNLRNVVLVERPDVNAYMFNAIAALPIGRDWRLQPYVAGGLGAIQLRSTVFTPTAAIPGAQAFTTQSAPGGDLGAGLTAFLGNFGVRADVRYYRAFTRDVSAGSSADLVAQRLLSGLDFWRASIGVAIRW